MSRDDFMTRGFMWRAKRYLPGLSVVLAAAVLAALTLSSSVVRYRNWLVAAATGTPTIELVAGAIGAPVAGGLPCIATDGAGTTFTFDPANLVLYSITATGKQAQIKVRTSDTARGEVAPGTTYCMVSDATGNLFVAETEKDIISKIAPDGTMSIFAGAPGGEADRDGSRLSARIRGPKWLNLDSRGNLYVHQSGTLRKIDTAGVVTTIPGERLGWASSMAVDQAGNFYYSLEPTEIYRRTPSGTITTIPACAAPGISGRRPQECGKISALAVDSLNNILLIDADNLTLKKITPAGVVSTLAGRQGRAKIVDGIGTEAGFDNPRGIALDGAGNIYVADHYNLVVRKISAAGAVTTVTPASHITGALGTIPPAIEAVSNAGLEVDGQGNVVFVGQAGHLYKLGQDGTVDSLPPSDPDVLSGDGRELPPRPDYSGSTIDRQGNTYIARPTMNWIERVAADGVRSSFAQVPFGVDQYSLDRFYPHGLASDAKGNLYVAAETGVLKRAPDGKWTVLAGAPSRKHECSAGRFGYAHRLAVDAGGNVFVTDWQCGTVSKISPAGHLTVLAGIAGADASEFSRFLEPGGIAVAADGYVYFTDTGNNSIVQISPAGVATRFAGQIERRETTLGFLPGSLLKPSDLALDNQRGIMYVREGTRGALLKIRIGNRPRS